jgi:hypothetical protein
MESSGRFLFRPGPALHSRLISYAKGKGGSLNSACCELLSQALGAGGSGQLPFGLGRLLEAESPVGCDIEAIILYGSYARQEATPRSDIDILLALSGRRPITRQLYRKIDSFLSAPAHLSVMTAHLPAAPAQAGGLWLEMAQDGVVLYDRSGAAARVLSDIRREIAHGRVSRRECHGQGYWVYAQ